MPFDDFLEEEKNKNENAMHSDKYLFSSLSLDAVHFQFPFSSFCWSFHRCTRQPRVLLVLLIYYDYNENELLLLKAKGACVIIGVLYRTLR